VEKNIQHWIEECPRIDRSKTVYQRL